MTNGENFVIIMLFHISTHDVPSETFLEDFSCSMFQKVFVCDFYF